MTGVVGDFHRPHITIIITHKPDFVKYERIKMKIYKVEFLVRKQGETNYFIYIEAKNQRNAKEAARQIWGKNHCSHMFHLTAKSANLDHYKIDTFYRIREY